MNYERWKETKTLKRQQSLWTFDLYIFPNVNWSKWSLIRCRYTIKNIISSMQSTPFFAWQYELLWIELAQGVEGTGSTVLFFTYSHFMEKWWRQWVESAAAFNMARQKPKNSSPRTKHKERKFSVFFIRMYWEHNRVVCQRLPEYDY